MARLPDLLEFAATARSEDRHHRRPDPLSQPHRVAGQARSRAPGGDRLRPLPAVSPIAIRPPIEVHLALVKGEVTPGKEIAGARARAAVRHRSAGCRQHCALVESERGDALPWPPPKRCDRSAPPQRERRGRPARAPADRPAEYRRRPKMDLRTYGIGAQILKDLGVTQDEADGHAAQDAEHGRLRPRGDRLSCCPEQARTVGRSHFPQRSQTGEIAWHAMTTFWRSSPNLNGQGLRVGIVMSRFNVDVSEGLLAACTDELRRHGVQADRHVAGDGTRGARSSARTAQDGDERTFRRAGCARCSDPRRDLPLRSGVRTNRLLA